jgi:hypothetical protein
MLLRFCDDSFPIQFIHAVADKILFHGLRRVRLTLRFSGGAQRRPLQPVVGPS